MTLRAQLNGAEFNWREHKFLHRLSLLRMYHVLLTKRESKAGSYTKWARGFGPLPTTAAC